MLAHMLPSRKGEECQMLEVPLQENFRLSGIHCDQFLPLPRMFSKCLMRLSLIQTTEKDKWQGVPMACG